MEDVRQLEQLMSELGWLKRLATALLRDESDANDLVQDTWLVAVERAPTDGRPLKPWLSRVALNLVRMRSRASKRRRAREAVVETAEKSPTPDELVGRLRAQRVVADEVLKLAEPYRSTVLLHYFEDLSSAEIARRSGTPEGTVRRRLKVALDELRGRLHAEERKTGQAIVAVLAPVKSAASAALGVVVVKKVIALVVVVIGLLLIGAHYKHGGHADKPVVEAKLGSGVPRAVVPTASHIAHIVVAVTDGVGPVADAFVRCAPTDGEVVVVKTASDGTASVDLAAGQWSIAASAEGHEPAAVTFAVAAGRDDRVKLVLASGGQTLTGIITDVTGGEVAGARIDAARLGLDTKASGAVAVAFSDRAGRYKLAIGAGEILVAASHPEYAPQTRYVDLGSNGATANFALVPGGVIEGVVQDMQTKQPVAGAIVSARSNPFGLELVDVNQRLAKADAAGKFRFAGLPPTAYELTARDGARSSRVPVGVAVGVAEQQTTIIVTVGATATIRGKVVDENGAPAPNVTVEAEGSGEGGETVSDAAGAFVLEGLAPNRWALHGRSDSYITNGQAIVQLKKSDVDGIVVRVRRGLEVRGHVEPRKACDVAISKIELGSPIPRDQSATTNADGEFHFVPFGPGNAALVARCSTGEEGSLAIAVGGGDSVIPLTPGGSIEGRVVDTSGNAIAGVMVSAEVTGDLTQIVNGAVTSGFKALTSATGAFAIGGLGVARYHLSVLDIGRPLKAKKAVKLALAAGQHATGVDVVVDRPNGKIEGTVTGPDGAPLADAWVALHQNAEDLAQAMSDPSEPTSRFFMSEDGSGSRDPAPAMTDARGHFELTNLVRGKYQVSAEAQGGKLRGSAADVTTDAQIAIKLAGVSSLHGTVHGPHGPTDLFTVRLAGPTSDDRSFTDGAFAFARLDPGDYTIDVTSSDGTGKATAHVSNDGASVDIALVANGTITGRVVDKTGKPLSGIGVILIPDQPPGQLQIEVHEIPPTTGPDGRFSVEGVPGVRTLVILGPHPTPKRGISVASGNTLDVGDVIEDEQK